MNNEDSILRNLIASCASKVSDDVKNSAPTVFSLQDTVNLIVKKYGENWRDYAECKCTVIWASQGFILDHVKEVVPDLYDLCEEYHNKGTVNGKTFADNFSMMAFYVVDPRTEKIQREESPFP